MVPEQLTAGQYTGTVTVQAAGMKPKQVKVTLNVTDNLIANHGDNEPWRHSRLRWLNSQIGFDDEVIAPYIPLNVQDKTISLLGRKVTLQPNGFPAQITSYFKETLTEIGTEDWISCPDRWNSQPEKTGRTWTSPIPNVRPVLWDACHQSEQSVHYEPGRPDRV